MVIVAYVPHTHDLGRQVTASIHYNKTGQNVQFVDVDPQSPIPFYWLDPYITV